MAAGGMNREILRLAVPNIISNISIPLLGIVDTALMGHLESELYLGAIAIGGVIFNFIYWGFGFLRMGTTGFTAQAHGSNNERETRSVLLRAMLVSVVIGGLLIILQRPIIQLGLLFIPASDEVAALARNYFLIRIYAAPATLGLYVFTGWFLGRQNAVLPMLLAITVNVLNIGFNFLFVLHYDMKSDGVAYGTLLAQYGGFLLAIALYSFKYRATIPWIALKDLKALKRFFSVNFDIFIRTLCLIFTFYFFTAQSAAGGDMVLAVNTILLQLIGLLSYGIDGFAFASESLVGKYIGAGDQGKLKRAIKLSFKWGIGVATIYALFFILFQKPILSVFTNSDQIIEMGSSLMIWIIIAPLINSFCYIWDGIYIGATASKPMRNSMFIATFLIYVPLYFVLKPIWPVHGLWFAFTVFMAARGLLLTFTYERFIIKNFAD